MKELLDRVTRILADQDGVAAATTVCVQHGRQDIVVGVVQLDGITSEIELRAKVTAELGDACPPIAVWAPGGQVSAEAAISSEEVKAALENGWCVPFVAPATPAEQVIADLWSKALEVPAIGMLDDFLDLGGDSLGAVLILSGIEDKLGIKIEIRDFMDASTIRGLSELVAGGGDNGQP
ncbi:phosphopantetheine-binding protein [Streptomyces sp. NPDC050085]|uniref:phosphopantetheine-binding protein n=1 Tax=Streptomyces sp. NPDC050085 TaxID=3365600 RepID=UPI0037B3E23A